MKKKRTAAAIAAALAMLLLILDSRTAMEGVRDGIDLCIRTLIPSLFPFFIFSGLLTAAMNGRPIGILRPVCRLCGIPEGAESLLAVGFLYPIFLKKKISPLPFGKASLMANS